MGDKPTEEQLKQKLMAHAKGFPFFNLMGYEPIDFGPGWAKCQISFREELANPNGVVHGGVVATLLDATITQAMLMTDAYQMLRDTRGMMTTVDLRVKYLRPLSEGTLICEAQVPRIGRKLAHANAVVKSDAGKEIALGDSIIMIMPGDRKA